MKRLLVSVLIVLFGFSLVCAQAKKQIVFTQSKAYPDIILPEKVEFSAFKAKFTINSKGVGVKKGKSTTRFRLKTDGGLLERVYFVEFQDDLILQYELNYGGEGNAFIVRLDGKTLRPKWRANIPTFNTGQGLIENNFAYVTAIGFVAKINLNSGKYAWKHNNLYGKGGVSDSYNYFILPKIKSNQVFFQEETVYERTPKVIKVNKLNGKVLKF